MEFNLSKYLQRSFWAEQRLWALTASSSQIRSLLKLIPRFKEEEAAAFKWVATWFSVKLNITSQVNEFAAKLKIKIHKKSAPTTDQDPSGVADNEEQAESSESDTDIQEMTDFDARLAAFNLSFPEPVRKPALPQNYGSQHCMLYFYAVCRGTSFDELISYNKGFSRKLWTWRNRPSLAAPDLHSFLFLFLWNRAVYWKMFALAKICAPSASAQARIKRFSATKFDWTEIKNYDIYRSFL